MNGQTMATIAGNGPAAWSIGSGVYSSTAADSTSIAYQNVGFQNGRKYQVSFDVTAFTSGSLTAGMGGSPENTAASPAYAATGSYQMVLSTTSGANGNLVFTPNATTGFVGSVDNVVVKEVLGGTSARGLTITKTVKGSDGANCTLTIAGGLIAATTCP